MAQNEKFVIILSLLDQTSKLTAGEAFGCPSTSVLCDSELREGRGKL